jgi:uracil-DNA glycosylase
VKSGPVGTFAFGADVLARPPSAIGRREYYVLGAYPSGLHIHWTPPPLPGHELRPVQALIVDNEPVPFWDGNGVLERYQHWVDHVNWRPAWGQVRPAEERFNGPTGGWMGQHVLAPLGVRRDEACISDCLDVARLSEGQARRLKDTYNPVAALMGLPPCTLAPAPDEAEIVEEAKNAHLDRLREELRQCQPRTVITLGNAALRVMIMLLDDVEPFAPKDLVHAAYGRARSATFEGRQLKWLPLVHPRAGANIPAWVETHTRWENQQPSASWTVEATGRLIDERVKPQELARLLKRFVERQVSKDRVSCAPGKDRNGGYTGYIRVFDPDCGSPTPIWVNYSGRIDYRLLSLDLDHNQLTDNPDVMTTGKKHHEVWCMLTSEAALDTACSLASEALAKSRA